jgi:hypothetical protein
VYFKARFSLLLFLLFHYLTYFKLNPLLLLPPQLLTKLRALLGSGFHHNGWVLGGGKKCQGKKRSHGCCGKVPLAIGAGTSTTMAIVASAFNTDHPNMLSPTIGGYVSFNKNLALSSSINVSSFEQNLNSNVDWTRIM